MLLDADPLADITNTTAVRAVVANGRYFDRTALDRLKRQARDWYVGRPHVTLDQPTITLSTVAPYDAIRLTAVVRDTLGRPIRGLPPVVYESLDTARVRVTYDGRVTAVRSGQARVLAEVQHHVDARIRTDTAWITVTTDSMLPRLTRLSIMPMAPDSAIWATADRATRAAPFMESIDILLLQLTGWVTSVRILAPKFFDGAGRSIPGLAAEYRSLDAAVAQVERRSGAVTLRRHGRARFVVRATAYGVSLTDTGTFTVKPSPSRQFTVRQDSEGRLAFDSRGRNEIRIRPYEIVTWINMLGDTVDVTFDDPTAATSPPVALCDTLASFIGALVTTPAGPHCGSGNAFMSPAAEMSAENMRAIVSTLRVRQFTKPGVYRFRSLRTGTTGRVIVTSSR